MRWRGLVVVAFPGAMAVVATLAWACAGYLDADAGAADAAGDTPEGNDGAMNGDGGVSVMDGNMTAVDGMMDGPDVTTAHEGGPTPEGSALDGPGTPDASPPPTCDAGCYGCTIIAANPILYLRFDDVGTGTAVDQMGHFNGTYPNAGATSVSGALGNDPDTAVHVDNSATGGIHMPASADFAGSGAKFSVELWIKPDANAADTMSGGVGFVIDHDEPPSLPRAGWDLYLSQANVAMEFWEPDGGIYGVANSMTPLATAGSWHYVVADYDGTQAQPPFLWIDNQVVFQSNISSGVLSVVAAGWSIGWQNCPGEGPCNGTNYVGAIDELAIYPRLLNATEVNEHWTAATATTCADGG
jgi:Concanavalin A-like lectin/glucanases superfamily